MSLTGYVKGAAWGDIDNDGFPDLAIAQSYGPAPAFPQSGGCEGEATFCGAPIELEPARSSSVVFFDYDQDGWLDLFVGGFSKIGSSYASGQVAADLLGQPTTAELSHLYHNEGANSETGKVPFRDVTSSAHLNRVFITAGCMAADFDNDGWPDLYLSTGASGLSLASSETIATQSGGRAFEDVSSSAGIAHLQKGSAVAVGDVDGDGDQDILQILGGEFPGDIFPRALFINPGNTNHWLTLDLVGTKTNRSAMGARITVEIELRAARARCAPLFQPAAATGDQLSRKRWTRRRHADQMRGSNLAGVQIRQRIENCRSTHGGRLSNRRRLVSSGASYSYLSAVTGLILVARRAGR